MKNIKKIFAVQCPYISKKCKYSSFTLAEVIIILGIIGIVTALIIPAVRTNVNKKAWSEAQYIVKRKIQEAANQMKVAGKLHGYSSTEEFVKEFRKYMKFVQVCDNTKLKDCYAPKVVVTADKEIQVSDLQTSENLGHKDYNTKTMGLVIADGTTIIMSYNPNCPYIEPSNNTTDTLSCLSMIYDINGKKGPNKIGDDIASSNAVISTCDIKIGNKCAAASDTPYNVINTCAPGSGDPAFTKDKVAAEFGTKYESMCEINYWYGAKKACEAL